MKKQALLLSTVFTVAPIVLAFAFLGVPTDAAAQARAAQSPTPMPMTKKIPMRVDEVLFELKGGLSGAEVLGDIQSRKLAQPLLPIDEASLEAHGMSAAEVAVAARNVASSSAVAQGDKESALRAKAIADGRRSEAAQDAAAEQLKQQAAFAASQTASAGAIPADWTWDKTAIQRASHAELEGKPPRPLDLSNWTNGQIKMADLRGKVVVIDFYATWCGPCMMAIPENNALLAKYKANGLVLFGVCTSNRGQGAMAATVKAHDMQYPTANDPKLISERNWHVHYYPTIAVIDRKGIVRVVGLQPEHLKEVVRKLLAEPAQ